MRYGFDRWKPEISPSDGADGDGGGAGGGGGGAGDFAALKKALDAERALREKAERALKVKQDAEDLANKSLTEQVAALTAKLAEADATLQKTTADFEGRLTRTATQYKFVAALQAAGVLPEYADRFADLAGSLTLDRDQLMSNGQPFDAGELRKKYPAMFLAAPDGVGSGAPPGSTPPATPPAVRVVKITDRAAMSAIEPNDLITGKVVLEE